MGVTSDYIMSVDQLIEWKSHVRMTKDWGQGVNLGVAGPASPIATCLERIKRMPGDSDGKQISMFTQSLCKLIK